MAFASPRLSALEALHTRLDEEIRDEMARPSPDHLRLTELKRRKLRIKETIATLRLAERAVARADAASELSEGAVPRPVAPVV